MSTTVRYEYISPGVIDVIDATGAKTRMNFTSTGQIQSIQDPLNRATNFTYDTNGYLSQITAPGNTIYKYSYDSQGRLLSQTDPLNQSVSFTYGANSDSPTKVTDQKGNALQYAYNRYGELTGITYTDGNSETFTYDRNGNLIEAKERSGDVFKYTYDAAGRITRKTFDDGKFEQYTYDTKGNLASVSDVNNRTTLLVYDANNRLTKITYPNSRFLEFAYDTQGRRTQMKDQSGFTSNYIYDADGRLSKLTNASGATIISYNYDTVGRLSRETNGNGTYTTYAYDNAGQVTSIINYASNNSINSSFAYTYDSLGRQTGVTTRDGTWAYTYDTTGQLARARFTSTNTSIANQDLQYVYDAAGNRIQTIVNGVTTNYTTNNQNQYTTVGGATYTYDADGNLTKVVDGTRTWTYTYNDENKLIGAVTPEGTFSYEYDAFGNRVASVQNGQRTEYLIDPFGLGDVVGEYNGSAATNYVHGIGLVGRFAGSNAAYYDSDLLGSTAGLTNSTGSYINRYAYRPFGENLLTTEGVANSFEYVGQWGVMDESNGLDFMRARFYKTNMGRFTSADPLLLTSGDLVTYNYSYNNPINFVDIDGNIPRSIRKPLNKIRYNIKRSIIPETHPIGNKAKTFPDLGLKNRTFKSLKHIHLGDVHVILDKQFYQAAGNRAILRYAAKGVLRVLGPYGLAAYSLWEIYDNWDEIADFLKNLFPNLNPDRDNWEQAKQTISPLVFDLDGDGIELISLEKSNAFFDLDADGFAERTGWVQSDDGLLALDKNGNGVIDDITEVFGNSTTDGFIILKQLDSNNDNLIDSRDSQFANLRVWKDVNTDGFTDFGELKSVTDWNIQSISLNYQAVNLINAGNRISSISTYTRTNGISQQIVDVWFALDQGDTFYNLDYQLKEEALFLPTLRGYGELPDLYISLSKDSTLLNMMRSLVFLSINNFQQFHAQFTTQLEALLFRWAGVENIVPNSRGIYIDGRKLTFLEVFFGEAFNQNGWGANPGPQASNILDSIWSNLFREMLGRLLVQGQMQNFFPETVFNLASDTLETSSSLDTILNSLRTNAPTNSGQAILYWNFAVTALDAFEGRFNLSQEDFDARIAQVLANAGFSGFLNTLRQADFLQAFANVTFGTSGNDTINGTTGNDQINGAAGNDTISGGAGNDILDGGIGNDRIDGGDGNDTIKAGFGTDTVDGGNGQDTLELDLSGQTANLTITNPLNGGTLPGIASATNIEFLKLTAGSGNDTITQATTINGSIFRSNDIFNGGAGNDIINAGLGLNDQVNGGSGVDTLILNYSVNDVGNQMQFTIAGSNGNGFSGSAGRTATTGGWLDSISFTGIDRFNITATRNADTIDVGGTNSIINAGDGNDTVTLRSLGFTADGGAGTDKLLLNLSAQTTDVNITVTPSGITTPGFTNSITNFESISLTNTGSGNDVVNLSATVGDGGYWNYGSEVRLGAGNDSVIGGTGTDAFYGEAGNDTLDGGADRDRLEGGDGNDILRGGAGDDNGERLAAGVVYGGLYGGAGNDSLDGGAGNDYLDPGTGVDTIIGGTGNDVLNLDLSTRTTAVTVSYTSTASGTVTGGTTFREIEQLFLKTGSGNDVVNLAASVGDGGYWNYGSEVRLGAGNDSVIGGTGTDAFYGEAGNDTLDGGADRDRLEGGDGNDILRGGAGDDNDERLVAGVKYGGLYGGAGNDTLDGGAGNDYLDPGSGVDSVIGGLGNDVLNLDLSTRTTAVTVSYTSTASGTVTGGTTFREIEQLFLKTGSGNDVVNLSATVGDGGYWNYGSEVRLGAGNDSVIGGTGTDAFYGEAGNDTLDGGADRDRLEGGDGNDILRGGAGDDNDERLVAGVKYGGLYGGAGNDTLDGGAGNDYLDPGSGVDSVIGGLGNDVLNLDLSTRTTAVTVSYTSTASGTVTGGTTFREIEQLFLKTGSANDVVNLSATVGSGGSWNYGSEVRLGAGNDSVIGGTGTDALYGEAGNDTLDGGADRDRLEGGDDNDILRGGAGDDNRERLVAGVEYGGLYGGAGNDTLDGGDGNDYLDPGTGVDSVIGGLGNDVLNLDLSTRTTAVTINYTSTASGTVTGGTTFREIEQLFLKTGSANDVVNLSATVGSGGSWNYGSEVRLGAGNDSVIGGTGTDALYGEAGNDTLDGGVDRDRLEGGDGNDILRGGAGDDNDERLVAGVKYGGLYGDAGNDQLFGDAGNDWLAGGAGNDTLTGGTGIDKFVFDIGTAFTTSAMGSDRITDFVTGTDKIVLDKTTFTALTTSAGSNLNASEFAVINESTNGATVAGASIARMVFNRFNGDLFYNADGATSGLGSGGYFATLSGVTTLSTTDILLQA
ncbi:MULTISPECIES: RHS repeat-associated core domain-containing protein [Calothrix]|uniref:Teneurin-like YD-shell domain-containing protein n=2 Tax=Calothrix TaxID=1186 RepID=A0ABR8A542_9CYAN|nr:MULTISPECIES: RHS repeat-associated core domain-containing protein [Calothrix]MBD2195080.1 hypothetical protein [Calothrix parietina FACHB-288]MBD2223678.1 hypothetical protein [Calothrix anomala FACHB-343]